MKNKTPAIFAIAGACTIEISLNRELLSLLKHSPQGV
jgi:hypothetical protein